MAKDLLKPMRYCLYLVKHEPPGWSQELERIAIEEFDSDPEFQKFVTSKLDERKFKDLLLQSMKKLAKEKKARMIIRPSELSPAILYFKYAYEKEFESMSELEQEWWIERDVSLVLEEMAKIIKSKKGGQ